MSTYLIIYASTGIYPSAHCLYLRHEDQEIKFMFKLFLNNVKDFLNLFWQCMFKLSLSEQLINAYVILVL